MSGDSDELDYPATVDDGAAEPEPLATPDDPQTKYAHAEAFFEDYLRHMASRPVGKHHQHKWAAEWWRSIEAQARIVALWRAWEFLRLDPGTGLAVWFKEYCDPMMGELMSADGPFARCEDSNTFDGSDQVGWAVGPLPHRPPPPDSPLFATGD